MDKRKANSVDVYVGKKIREARLRSGLTLAALAESLGITSQQLQKYENGFTRVGCSRLYAISRVFSIPVQAFFSETDGEAYDAQEQESGFGSETRDLVSAYSNLNPCLRRSVAKTAKSLAEIFTETP